MATKPRLFIPDQIIRALEKTDGNKTGAARLLKCSPQTITNMCNEYPHVQLKLDRILDDRVLLSKPNEKYSVDEMAKAIIRARGNQAACARWLGCARDTVANYIAKHEEVRKAYENASELSLDNIEFFLYENAERGSVAAQTYWLRTKGKKRGWSEKYEEPPIPKSAEKMTLSARQIAGSFFVPYNHIQDGNFVEFVLRGGRGSTKSSFASLAIVEAIWNNPDWHVLACREVGATLRDSVFSQIQWAIEYLGKTQYFHFTRNPLEITYNPTGQKIYFRGADDPLKIKSIKPPFGYIAVLWFEELDQFKGPEAVRSIVQSAIRGGEKAFIIKSYNPPRSRNNWVNKDLEIKKKNRFVHTSNYLDVPENWLGKVFLDEALHLKEINPAAYEHEYMGEVTGTGGLVFENVNLDEITDEEISQFERPLHGLDWGYFPDPAHYGKCYYDAARMVLYIYGEVRRYKHSNKKLYKEIVESGLAGPEAVIICDSAEPKSVADFREYGTQPQGKKQVKGKEVVIMGPGARGAEKGPESVKYSMKWLQGLVEIRIDPARAPLAAEEFINYEHEIDKDGNYISSYPDKNNHAIDFARYATNLIWKRRGQ